MTLLKTETSRSPGPDGTAEEPGKDRRLLNGYLHKTSNTLCGIKGYASLIADRETVGGDAGLWARKIIAEVERMEEIFRSVADLTRGRGNPDESVDLCCLVEDVTAGFRVENPDVDLRLGPVPQGMLRLPSADLTLLLTEVLRNSAESARCSGDRVLVAVCGTADREGRIHLTFRDDGCGMEPELLRQAADPFVTTKDGHNGVGLTRVATLMDMYGLSWRLESEEGHGTLVTLEVAEEF
jgi:signal transduction histidine kinase